MHWLKSFGIWWCPLLFNRLSAWLWLNYNRELPECQKDFRLVDQDDMVINTLERSLASHHETKARFISPWCGAIRFEGKHEGILTIVFINFSSIAW